MSGLKNSGSTFLIEMYVSKNESTKKGANSRRCLFEKSESNTAFLQAGFCNYRRLLIAIIIRIDFP